jgi:hypothetical protein
MQLGEQVSRKLPNSRIVVACIFLVAPLPAVSCRHSQSTEPVSIDLTKLHVQNDSSQLTQISLTPIKVVQFLPESVKSRIPKMSNPGGPFNASDVSGFFDTPRRRLIFGGISDRYCLVHYEYGGIAHGHKMALFEISGNQSMLLWAHAGGRYSDLIEFAKETDPKELTNEMKDAVF